MEAASGSTGVELDRGVYHKMCYGPSSFPTLVSARDADLDLSVGSCDLWVPRGVNGGDRTGVQRVRGV